MPESRSTRTVKPAYGEARAELINAAMRIVASRGLRGLSHRAVAKEAGVTHGLVGHYFGSMTTLLAAALDTVLARSMAADPVSIILRTAPPASAAELTDWILAQQELHVFEYEVLLAARDEPELVALAERLYEGYTESAARAFEAAGHPRPDEDVLLALTAAIDGIVLQSVSFRSPDDPRLRAAMLRIRAAVHAALPERPRRAE